MYFKKLDYETAMAGKQRLAGEAATHLVALVQQVDLGEVEPGVDGLVQGPVSLPEHWALIN